jgi:hypothetical protein
MANRFRLRQTVTPKSSVVETVAPEDYAKRGIGAMHRLAHS